MAFDGINVPNFVDTNIYQTVNNTFNTFTGSDVAVSFFYDFPFTGLAVGESFIPKGWNFTGYSLGSTITGSGFTMSGNIYQRSSTSNAKSVMAVFTYETGRFFKTSGGFSIPVTGNSRVGVDVTAILSGLQGFTMGIYGI